MTEYNPREVEQRSPLSPEAQEAVEQDYARYKVLAEEIDAFLNPESGGTPGGSELRNARIDFAQRTGIEVEEATHALDQIVQISHIVELELARLRKQLG